MQHRLVRDKLSLAEFAFLVHISMLNHLHNGPKSILTVRTFPSVHFHPVKLLSMQIHVSLSPERPFAKITSEPKLVRLVNRHMMHHVSILPKYQPTNLAVSTMKLLDVLAHFLSSRRRRTILQRTLRPSFHLLNVLLPRTKLLSRITILRRRRQGRFVILNRFQRAFVNIDLHLNLLLNFRMDELVQQFVQRSTIFQQAQPIQGTFHRPVVQALRVEQVTQGVDVCVAIELEPCVQKQIVGGRFQLECVHLVQTKVARKADLRRELGGIDFLAYPPHSGRWDQNLHLTHSGRTWGR